MFEQEIADFSEQVHGAFTFAVFAVTAVNSMVLVWINHQIELHSVGYHRLDELHGVLVMDVVVTGAVADSYHLS